VAGLGAATAQEIYADPAIPGAVPGAASADYYPDQHERVYVQNRQSDYGYSQPAYYQPPQDPLIPNLYPTAILGGLGALGMAYFRHVIDQSYNKSLHAFENLHHNVDHRLEHLEDAIYNRGKEQKKLDFKTKMLCKFANLFNNPTYEICNQGFDGGQVVGPTGAHSGYGHAEDESGDGGAPTGSGTGSGTGSAASATGDDSGPSTGTGTGTTGDDTTGTATGDDSGTGTGTGGGFGTGDTRF